MMERNLTLESFELRNRSGEVIRGDLRFLRATEGRSSIIICHSFMAFKDWGFFPYVCEQLAKAGFVSIVFNFSRNGVVDDKDRITNFAAFERNTFTHELEDLGIVIDAVSERGLGSYTIDPERIVLLGHSRGGGIAILQTAADPRVKGLITWSAVSTLDRWTVHQKDQWRKAGALPLAKDSTTSPLRMGIGLLQDLEQHREQFDLLSAASRISTPWLILHGKADVMVSPKEAEQLHTAANRSTAELILLDRVGHLYNAASSDEDNYQTLDHVLHLTINWLQLRFL